MKIKPFRLLMRVIRRCHFQKMLAGFLVLFFLGALVIQFCDPGVTTYGDACWFMFASCTTIGYGDITVTGILPRLVTVCITVYEIVIVALLSGVIVSYYIELMKRIDNEVTAAFLDKMEHLTELSPEELAQMEANARKMRG